MDPLSLESYDFLAKFNRFRKHLSKKAKFLPIMRFQNLSPHTAYNSDTEKHGQSMQYIKNHCYAKGTYCHNGLNNGEQIGGRGGIDIMNTAILHLCLHNENEDLFY
jgi:hypothetical protein